VFLDESAILHWDVVANAEIYVVRIRLKTDGDLPWDTFEVDTNNIYMVFWMHRAYEWQVSAKCAESTSDWSDLCGFISNDTESGNCTPEPAPTCEDGIQNQGEEGIDCGGIVCGIINNIPCSACPAPEAPRVLVRILGSVSLVNFSWSTLSNISGYEVRLREKGAAEWQEYTTNRNLLSLPRVSNGSYEWQVRGICMEGEGSWTEIEGFEVANPRFSLQSEGGITHNGVQVYPNPAVGSFTLVFERPLERAAKVRLLNLFGQTVWQGVVQEGVTQHEVDVAALPGGVYLLDSGANELIKIIVQ
jgi:hypothetical protein